MGCEQMCGEEYLFDILFALILELLRACMSYQCVVSVCSVNAFLSDGNFWFTTRYITREDITPKITEN